VKRRSIVKTNGLDNSRKTVAIVNPVAGRGRAPRDWPRLLDAMGPEAYEVETWWSGSGGDAESLAARARREGYGKVIAVGGDGTIFDVVNGLWWESSGEAPMLGAVPFGTGCDYLRNYRVPHDPFAALMKSLRSHTARVSVGTCRLQSLDGEPIRRAFVNAIGAGLDGDVVAAMNRRAIHRFGKAAYVLPAFLAILKLRSYRFEGTVDGEPFATGASILVTALGRYFGGGMKFAPKAALDADRMQLLWCNADRWAEMLSVIPLVYFGRHLAHPCMKGKPVRHVKLEADPPALVEADGELLGRTPLEVELHPSALRFAGELKRCGCPG
jgi:diacylglycerol kinase (ATP)